MNDRIYFMAFLGNTPILSSTRESAEESHAFMLRELEIDNDTFSSRGYRIFPVRITLHPTPTENP